MSLPQSPAISISISSVSVGKHGNSFRQLRTKLQMCLANLRFLTRCNRSRIIPNFITVTTNQKDLRTTRILHMAKLKLLRASIRRLRQKTANLEQKLYDLHLRLASTLHPITWNRLDSSSYLQTLSLLEPKETILNKKFEALSNKTIAPPDLQKTLPPEPPEPSTGALFKPPNSEENAKTKEVRNPKIPTATQPRPNNPTLVNLSSSEISQETSDVLQKGLNFSITPRHLPIEEIITSVEEAMRHLPSENQQEIRKTLKFCIAQAPPPSQNLNHSQLTALRKLRNENLVITRADKGGATVILDRSEYNQKVENLLQNPSYIPIRSDPTSTVLKNLKKTVNSSKFIPLNQKFKLAPSTAQPPRIYAVPKLHKPGIPFRPIVSYINSPTYNLAKFVSNTIKSEIGNTSHHLNNSNELINVLKQLKLTTDDLLVSFDIKNLFTQTPVTESLDCLRQKLMENPSTFPPDSITDICNLTHFCTSNTYFTLEGKFYKQSEGLPMGSPLSPPLCDLYMEYFEKTALNTASLKPRHWLRYLDDILTIWPHGPSALPNFLTHLNSINPAIQFTFETEENRSLPFLDVLIIRNPDGSISTDVYRKPCFSANYSHATSNHHPSQITSFIKTLTHRAHIICSNQTYLTQELDYIKSLAIKQEIPETLVNSIFNNVAKKFKSESNLRQHTTLQPIPTKIKPKRAYIPFQRHISHRITKILMKNNIQPVHIPTTKIKSIVPGPLPPLPPNLSNGIYEIDCECGLSYIGQTKRSVKIRLSEHRRQLRSSAPVTSALALHALSENHDIQWDKAKIIAKPKTALSRNIRESLEILKKPHKLLNSDNGPINVNYWSNTLSSLTRQNKKSPDIRPLTNTLKRHAPDDHKTVTYGLVKRTHRQIDDLQTFPQHTP